MIKMSHSELCQQPEYGLSCAGCCGFLYEHRKSMIPGFIRENTKRFKTYLLKHANEKSGYFRSMPRHTGHNLCEYLIFLNEDESRIGCVAHPAINGIEYRENIINCMLGNCPNSWSFGRLGKLQKREILKKLQKEYQGNSIKLSLDMSKDVIKI